MSASPRCTGIRLSGDICAIATVEADSGCWSLDLDRCFVLQLADRGQSSIEEFHSEVTDLLATANISRAVLRCSAERGNYGASARATMMEAALKLSPDVTVTDVPARKISNWQRDFEPNLPVYRGKLPGRSAQVLEEAIATACFAVEPFTFEVDRVTVN